ncbi:uncharacterized protein LOC116801671 [Drosophila sechellia]|uniref:uncharacterized protein LOC116801671 n=1 Tax=Drosophila sechellia TaxID=7238 RepID=UPI0013DD9635|nr:uncharacterized protein LOC116801671 [Drosophila sechellia]
MHLYKIICLICFILGCASALKDPSCAIELFGQGACNTLITRIGYLPWENMCTSKNFVACDTDGTSFESIKECEDKCKE